jgi:hypothetical protein
MTPTPEQERITILAFIVFAGLMVIGAASLIYAIGLALVKTAAWVFT